MNLPRHKSLAAGLIVIVFVAMIFALMAALTAHGATISWDAVPTAAGYAILQNGRYVESTLDTTATVQTFDSTIQVAAVGPSGLWSAPSNPVYLVRCPRDERISLSGSLVTISALVPCPGTYQAQQRASLAGFWTDIGQPFAVTTGSASVSVPMSGQFNFYRLIKTN